MHWKALKSRESGNGEASLRNLQKAEEKIAATSWLSEEENQDLIRLRSAICGEWGDVREAGGLWDKILEKRDHYENCWLQYMSRTNREDMRYKSNKTFSEYLEKVERYLERVKTNDSFTLEPKELAIFLTDQEIQEVQSRPPPSLHIPGTFFPSAGQPSVPVPYHATYHVPVRMVPTPNNVPPGYHQYYSGIDVFPNGSRPIPQNYVGNQMHHHNRVENVSAPPTLVVQPSSSTEIDAYNKETDVRNSMRNLSIVDQTNISSMEYEPPSSSGGQHIALHSPVAVNFSAPPAQDVQKSETCDDSVCEQEKEDCHIGQSENRPAPSAQNFQKSTGQSENRPTSTLQTDSLLEKQMPSTPIRAIVQSSNQARSRASNRRSPYLGGYKKYINRPKLDTSLVSTVSENKGDTPIGHAQNVALTLLTDWRKSPERTSRANKGHDIAALLHEYLTWVVGLVRFEKTETEDILRFEESTVQLLQIYKDSGVDILADFAKRNETV